MLIAHFLNVGHGDCSIFENRDTGRTMMVDINTNTTIDETTQDEILGSFWLDKYAARKAKAALLEQTQDYLLKEAGYTIGLTDPIQYLKSLGNPNLFRFISTHPHIDHLTGFSLLQKVSNVWLHKNTHTQTLSKLSDLQKQDWKLYQSLLSTKEKKVNGVTVISPFADAEGNYWTEDGIKILSPSPEVLDYTSKTGKINNMSYVVLIEHCGHKILLGGDAETAAWEYILDKYEDEISDVDILKASHHGRLSGYYQKAVKVMNPKYTIVSVGKKPQTDATRRYTQYCDDVWSTRWKGTIRFTISSSSQIGAECEYDR